MIPILVVVEGCFDDEYRTKVWIVLKSSVLYELRAAEDPVAYLDTAILGYSLEPEYILKVRIHYA